MEPMIKLMHLQRLFCLAATLFVLGCASALPPLPPPQAQPPLPDLAAQRERFANTAYTIVPEDVLKIIVFEHPDLSLEVPVTEEGNFAYPLLGNVQAAGLTVQELEKQITRRLAKNYLVDPQVTVMLAKYRNRQIYVLGAVGAPGLYPLRHDATLLELLSQAGGPVTGAAGWYAMVVRGAGLRSHAQGNMNNGRAEQDVIRVDLEKLFTGETVQPVQLESGDTIYVPKAPVFYVMGQVRQPGRYPLEREMTITKAIILSGGFNQFAAKHHLKVRRIIEGKPQEFRVEMHNLLQDGDVLIVPESAF